jgi:DNA-binding phage protein
MHILTSGYIRERLLAPGVNLRAVASEARLNEKTLYRIRDGKNKPTLDTAEKIIFALDKLHPVKADTQQQRRGKA